MLKTTRVNAPFSYDGLDRVIHERARLSVLTSLARYSKGLRFGDLKALCGLTDGNLSRHPVHLRSRGGGPRSASPSATARGSAGIRCAPARTERPG